MKLLGFEITRPKQQQQVTNYVEPPYERKVGTYEIVKMASNIEPAEVASFKQWVKSARSTYQQERGKLYDAYADAIDFDPHLKALIEKRIIATTGRKLEYVSDATGDVYEPAEELIDNPEFSKFIEELVMTRFYGLGLFEMGVTEQGWFKYWSIPIKHIDPFEKVVRRMQFTPSEGDKSFENDKNAVFVGNPDSLGLMLQLALYALYKRAAIGDWAQYSQLAGTNFRQVVFRGKIDPGRRSQILNEINTAGSGSLAYDGQEFDLKSENQTSSSQNQLFENYVKFLNDEMSKLVLGQTMTTEDGSSRSQAEVHERQQETILENDAKDVLNILNYEMSEMWGRLYRLPSGRWRYAENVTAKQVEELERDKMLKDLGVVFTDQELRAKYITR